MDNRWNTWKRQPHPGIHLFSCSNLRRKFWQPVWNSNIGCRETTYLGKTDQNHSKILVPVGKPQLLQEQIFRDSPLALLDGYDLFPKEAMISPKCRMVLAFFIAMSYSIYFDMQIIPSFPVEMPCIKTVLPLWKQGVLLGLFHFKQPCFADRLQAEHAVLNALQLPILNVQTQQTNLLVYSFH